MTSVQPHRRRQTAVIPRSKKSAASRNGAKTADAVGRLVETVVNLLVEDLSESGSPLVEDDIVQMQLHSHARTIILAVLARLDIPLQVDNAADDYNAARIGLLRSEQSIGPANSVAAAQFLFARALVTIAAFCREHDIPISTERIALELNTVISSSVEAAAQSYGESVLEKIGSIQREERAVVARDLHDHVAHGISAGIMRLEIAEQEPNVEAAAELRRSSRTLLTGALKAVQDLATSLRPVIGPGSLLSATEELLHRVTEGTTIAFSVEAKGIPFAIPSVVQEQIIQIVREAARNARDHASPGRLRVEFTWHANRLACAVLDDGTGFDYSAIRPAAMGLIGMRERAELIRGTIDISSTPGEGTCVTFEVNRGA